MQIAVYFFFQVEEMIDRFTLEHDQLPFATCCSPSRQQTLEHGRYLAGRPERPTDLCITLLTVRQSLGDKSYALFKKNVR